MRDAVYLVGCGPMAAAVPAMARARGLAVVAGDRDPRAPGLARADEVLVADGADAEAHAAFARSLAGRFRIAGAYCGGEFGLESARRVQEAAGIPSNEARAVARALDKRAAVEAFAAAGLPVPRGAVARSAAELRALAREAERSLVVKPPCGSGSRGVRVLAPGDDPDAAFAAALAAVPGEDAVLVEPFLEGRSIDANGLLDGERYLPLGLLEKESSALPERLPLGGWDPAAVPEEEAREVHALVERGARALGLRTGPVKADLLRTVEGYVLLEVAPRFHGDVTTCGTLPFGSGLDPMATWLSWVASGELAPVRRPGAKGCATWRVLCLPPGDVLRLPAPPDPARHPGVTLLWTNPRARRRIEPYPDTPRVPGYAAACGATREEAEEALARWLAEAGARVAPDPAAAGWYRRLGERLDALGFARAACGHGAGAAGGSDHAA